MRLLALAVLLVLPAFPARAAKLAGADFLNQTQDVRVIGMGEAGQASAAGVGGLTVNPAAAHDIEAHEVYFTHQLLGNAVGTDFVGWGMSRGVHHFALSLLHVGYGSIDGRDDFANQTGGFSPSANAYGFTYGTTLAGAQLAASVKRVDFKIVSRAQTTAFDFGGRYKVNDDWTIAASGVNLGSGLKFDSVTDPLPARLSGGAAWHAGEFWTISVDLVGRMYSSAYAALGNEYKIRMDANTSFAVRVGLNTRTPDAGKFAGLKAGLGANFKSVSVDYAFGPGADVGDQHLFSLTWRFGVPAGAQGPKER